MCKIILVKNSKIFEIHYIKITYEKYLRNVKYLNKGKTYLIIEKSYAGEKLF